MNLNEFIERINKSRASYEAYAFPFKDVPEEQIRQNYEQEHLKITSQVNSFEMLGAGFNT